MENAIRDRIRQRIIELNLSVRGASIAAGLGETTVRNYLDEMTKSMTLATAEKLAPILKVSAQWILFGETSEVVDIWDHIPEGRRELALDVLKSFTQ